MSAERPTSTFMNYRKTVQKMRDGSTGECALESLK